MCSLMVFEIAFYNYNIMGTVYKGWEEMVGYVGKLKACSPNHYETDSGAVFSVGDRDVHNLQDRSRQIIISSSLAPHQFSLLLPSGSTCPVMHQCGFRGSSKVIRGSRPGYL